MFAGSPGDGLDSLLNCNIERYEMVRKETLSIQFISYRGTKCIHWSPFTLGKPLVFQETAQQISKCAAGWDCIEISSKAMYCIFGNPRKIWLVLHSGESMNNRPWLLCSRLVADWVADCAVKNRAYNISQF